MGRNFYQKGMESEDKIENILEEIEVLYELIVQIWFLFASRFICFSFGSFLILLFWLTYTLTFFSLKFA
jgi:hypothetical protein